MGKLDCSKCGKSNSYIFCYHITRRSVDDNKICKIINDVSFCEEHFDQQLYKLHEFFSRHKIRNDGCVSCERRDNLQLFEFKIEQFTQEEREKLLEYRYFVDDDDDYIEDYSVEYENYCIKIEKDIRFKEILPLHLLMCPDHFNKIKNEFFDSFREFKHFSKTE